MTSYQTSGLPIDGLNVTCWWCIMILLSGIPSSIISMVTKPRGSSGSSLETQMSWISLGNKYCVSVYTCFLTYDNMNADRTANEQLLHKSHCVPLPCPPHLHPVTQHRWEANILTNATLKINLKNTLAHRKYPIYLARHTKLRNILTEHHRIHVAHWNILHNPLIHISYL